MNGLDLCLGKDHRSLHAINEVLISVVGIEGFGRDFSEKNLCWELMFGGLDSLGNVYA